MREYRERRRRGRMVLEVEVDDRLGLALEQAGLLGEWDTENEAAVVRAAGQFLDDITHKQLGPRPPVTRYEPD
jgi:hypothetical protein